MEILQLLGRLHPVVLHLPIGMLILGYVMELLNKRSENKNYSDAIGLAIQLGMWSSILAAISGYWLSQDGGYEANLLQQHQWVGIMTAVVSIAIHFIYK